MDYGMDKKIQPGWRSFSRTENDLDTQELI